MAPEIEFPVGPQLEIYYSHVPRGYIEFENRFWHVYKFVYQIIPVFKYWNPSKQVWEKLSCFRTDHFSETELEQFGSYPRYPHGNIAGIRFMNKDQFDCMIEHLESADFNVVQSNAYHLNFTYFSMEIFNTNGPFWVLMYLDYQRRKHEFLLKKQIKDQCDPEKSNITI